jgi:hypothetical protein
MLQGKSMITIKNHNQKELFDPWEFLSPKRRQRLDRSWPGLFKNHILKELPVDKLAPFFRSGFGRPTKELHTVLGVLVLQEQLDLTDEETVDQLSYNIQWHYALNITEESDSAKYISPKTLWTMRTIAVENKLDTIMFENATKKLCEVFNVDPDKQRIDSVHIKSNMRRLGRINIFSTTIHKFLINVKRNHKELFDTIDKKLVAKYLSAKALQCFSRVKPSESPKTLSTVSKDLFDLVQQFKAVKAVAKMHSFKLLERVLAEQCTVNQTDPEKPVAVKAPKEVASDSLQNPCDPDAGYSAHKGQGYQVQIMETYSDTHGKDIKRKQLNVISHVDVEPAYAADANALMPAVESSRKRGLGPREILADSHYGSDENCCNAEQNGHVELVAPTRGEWSKKYIPLSDCTLSPKGTIVSCPQGHEPAWIRKKKTRHTAAFDCNHCKSCPQVETCPTRPGKKQYYYLYYTDRELRVARRRAYEQTDEFKDRYRWRAGVEATMSEYDRRTGVKNLRVRGLQAVRFRATLKALGLNIFRAAAVLAALINGPKHLMTLFSFVKELFLAPRGWLKNLFTAIPIHDVKLREQQPFLGC